MQKITPFMWFDDQAEEAVEFYTSIFKNSKPGTITRYSDAGPRPKGSVMTVNFQILGHKFIALNGGPEFSFTPAISFFVSCETQEEVDNYWEKLTEGGEEQPCGWLKDKYGVSWQIIPESMFEWINGEDEAGALRATEAMLQMKKIELEPIKQAYLQG